MEGPELLVLNPEIKTFFDLCFLQMGGVSFHLCYIALSVKERILRDSFHDKECRWKMMNLSGSQVGSESECSESPPRVYWTSRLEHPSSDSAVFWPLMANGVYNWSSEWSLLEHQCWTARGIKTDTLPVAIYQPVSCRELSVKGALSNASFWFRYFDVL